MVSRSRQQRQQNFNEDLYHSDSDLAVSDNDEEEDNPPDEKAGHKKEFVQSARAIKISNKNMKGKSDKSSQFQDQNIK